jgi:hypothetical protein
MKTDECAPVAGRIHAMSLGIIASTHYRWSMSRDSMLHEQRAEGDPDHFDW